MELENALQDPGATAIEINEYKTKLEVARARLAQIREGKAEAPFEGTPRLERIRTERVSQEIAAEIVARAGISVGDPLPEATAKRIRDIAKSVDEHLRVSFERKGNGIVLTIIAP